MATPVEGEGLSGAADTGRAPVKVGGVANNAAPTAATAGQRKDQWVSLNGAAVIAVNDTGGGGTDGRNLATVPSLSNITGQAAVAVAGYLLNGASWDRQRTPTVFKNLSATVITSETTIWTPAGGKKFRLMGFCLAQGVVTGAVTLKDNTSGSTILVIPQNTIGVYMVSPPMGNGILSAAANNVLTATGASTETLTGFVFGTEE